jgi:hypothetical protein
MQENLFTITGIPYKRFRLHYKLTIGAAKPVHYKQVFIIIEFTINGTKCSKYDIG